MTNSLEQMADCVCFEVYQLQRCMTLIKSGVGQRSPDVNLAEAVRTALLESVLVHARALDDFLGGAGTNGRWSDDVYATEFDPGWKPRRVLSEEQREAINKRLAHITTHRATGPKVVEIDPFLAILDAFGEFLVGLRERSPERRAWFKMEPSTIWYRRT